MQRNITRYESLHEIAEAGRAGEGASKATGRNDWYGTADYEEAVELAANGWWYGGNELEAAIRRIKPQVDKAVEVLARLVYMPTPNRPGVLDVGRYAAGHPYCMVSPVLSGSVPIVRVMVPCLWSASVPTKDIMEAGAVVSAVAEVLTAAGYAVEVAAVAGWDRRNGDAEVVEVILKQSTQRVDVEDLAFGIAHPSMSRRFIFAAGELNPHAREINCRTGGGYGGYSHWSGTAPSLIKGLGDVDLTTMATFASGSYIDKALAALAAWQSK